MADPWTPAPPARSLLPPLAGLEVVDLGCGSGGFVRWAHDRGAAGVLGLDLSVDVLERARRLGEPEGTRFEQADLAQLRLTFASYDVVWCDDVAHRLEDPLRLVRVANAGLRPGGVLVLVVPTPAEPALLQAVTVARMDLGRVEEVAGAGPGEVRAAVVARKRAPGPGLRTDASRPPSDASGGSAGPASRRPGLA